MDKLRRALPFVIGFVLFVVALGVLTVELRTTSWQAIVQDAGAMPSSRLWTALALTALNYLVLTGYDLLACATLERRLPPSRVMAASFLSFAIANNVGFAMLSGASIRYRFYTRWGLTREELSRVIFSYSVTFWIGLTTLGGFVLAFGPIPDSAAGRFPLPIAPFGWALIALTVGYLVATMTRTKPLTIGRFDLPLPKPGIALAQVAISSIDWLLAAAVLYVLLPETDLSWMRFLGAYIAAMVLGLASHIPGGAGVFEGLMVLLLRTDVTSAQLFPSFIVFRAIYYLVPLSIAVVGLVADELGQRREQAARVGAVLGQLTEELTPRLLAVFTFLAGIVLLFSGATPAAAGRLTWLSRVLPLSVIELSHFAGSVLGAGLLLISQGLGRRLDAAYYLSFAAIAAGIVAALLKGFDYEEALLLGFILTLLWRSRGAFRRRAEFFDTQFSAEWIFALSAAITASIWLGLFAFKHVNYSNELWWQFELHGEASRFLRASVGAAIVVLLFGSARLMQPKHHEIVEPTAAELDAAAAVIEAQPSTAPNLALLGDKALLFSDDRQAFVMYGVHGRTWVALGDPVGPPAHAPEMIRMFLERADDFNGTPVFYEVGTDHLHEYADVGLTFVKLGEEARVNLTGFSLDGGAHARQRKLLRHLEKEQASFRIVPREEVPAILDELQQISDEWLQSKSGSEKGFSLGFFDREYLTRFPVAVIEQSGHIQAFANVWRGGSRHEVSIDLMRYRTTAPSGTMETLLIELMLWGKIEGYRWFTLGMAPLAGVEHSPLGTQWNRIGAFLYEHGEAVYRFQGLRAFKEKFDPVWQPRYLAYPGGLKLPLILADISALIAGGYRQVFTRGAFVAK
ncbi:MAG TPA: bifunctional lysylphosphatidylglycerol flippase/synthetase MprF [Vicinamibacterales bacterium]|nr:bifunctional lysylphosphatidylglycerol flippase/synthetase MprF [Vicinamibacterales bacterium]